MPAPAGIWEMARNDLNPATRRWDRRVIQTQRKLQADKAEKAKPKPKSRVWRS